MRGLTREDFRLWEDGKEQKITSFSFEGQARRNERWVALVFEAEQSGLREEAIGFVDRFASPGFHVAVFSRVDTKMVLQQAFTEDAEQVKTVLRTMTVTVGNPMAGAQRGSNPFFDRVGSAAMALSATRGRKALILFSYGFYGYRSPGTPTNGRFIRPANGPLGADWAPRLIGVCNAANVSVYAFPMGRDAGISIDYYTRPSDPAMDQGGATDFIHDVAVGTGGKYMAPGKYDLGAYLRDVSNQPGEYYLLGFEPRVRSSDEPCHALSVKVAGKGLRMIARDSYCSQ